MSVRRIQRNAVWSWLLMSTLFVLCGILGFLQYRWIGEVSLADRDRLRGTLQTSLFRLSREFNNELTELCVALLPQNQAAAGTDADYGARYLEWKRTTQHGQIFRRIAVATVANGELSLRILDLERGELGAAEWPAEWSGLRQRMESRLSPEPWQDRAPPGMPATDDGLLFELPRFPMPPGGSPGTPPRGRFGRREGRREMDWLIVELNFSYIRDAMLPELLQRNLGSGGNLDYQVEISTRRGSPTVLYRSDPNQPLHLEGLADASVGLCDVQFEQLMRRRFNGFAAANRGLMPGPGPMQDSGRWIMRVRHRTGSLEAVVAQARWRNLAVTAGVLALMILGLAALLRYTRRAQRLAEMQMGFVASVSHELRTPLTVIHTAAYNLRGKVAANPAQVERYGALIQQESGRLTSLVEQVLRFSNTKAGRVIAEPRLVSIESIIDESISSSRTVIDGAAAAVEKHIDPDLPQVMGDEVALKHVLQNLLHNAAKYGTDGSNWIGVSASVPVSDGSPIVEIRVADRGPGIPPDEQAHIFDPFFRGRRAVRDQIHGTGLGLNLARQIVEAHHGSIAVESEPMKGTEFIVRIPAAPPEHQDEFSHSIG